MRFKLQTDYALQALMFMAARQGGNCTTDEIAAYFQISSAHLGRVIRRLQNYGYVKAIRGRRGGVRLAREAQSLTLQEVIERCEEGAEPLDDMVRAGDASPEQDFRLRAVVRRAHGMFLNYLSKVSFADLAVDGLPASTAPRQVAHVPAPEPVGAGVGCEPAGIPAMSGAPSHHHM